MANAAGAGLLAIPAWELQGNPLGLPIGSQTYPHRQRIKSGDFAGLCKDMAALGIGNVELCSPGYGEFASLEDGKQTGRIGEDHGLECPSAHFDLAELRNRQGQATAWAHDIGMAQMGTASRDRPAQNRGTNMASVDK